MGADVGHAGAALAVQGSEIGRKIGRKKGARPIWNWKLFEEHLECEIVFLEEGDVFFQRKSEIMPPALRDCLGAISLERRLRPFKQRPSRREKHSRDDAANNRAMKMLVVGEVGQDRIGTASCQGELDRPAAQSLFQFIQIEIKKRPRIADDHNRIRFYSGAPLSPKIGGIVQGRSVAASAATDFPRSDGNNDNKNDGRSDPPKRKLWNRTIRIGSR